MASVQTLHRFVTMLVAAGIPIDGVSGLDCSVSPPTARIDFKPEATAQQRADAAAILAAFDCSQSANDAFENLQARTESANRFDNSRAITDKQLRAVALVIIDELNVIRSWVRSFKTEVAAATNLANLQSRVAGLPNLPDRTPAQAITAIKDKINSGAVD